MALYEQDISVIRSMVHEYFVGLHCADVARLRALFDPAVVLKAPGVRRTMDEWLELVSVRQTPEAEGYAFEYRIVSIEIFHDQAMVKAHCPLLGNNYLDYLGFLREDNKWLVVSKMYSTY